MTERRRRSAPVPPPVPRFVVVQPRGAWHGRGLSYDPDGQALEQERQRWVYEHIAGMNEAIVDLAVDPDQEYARLREEYERTGNLAMLNLALEYVK